MGLTDYIPLAGAIGSVFGSVSQASANKEINQQNIDFSREMYDKQKADNIAFWNMQNAYNSPEEQMQRFQAAGLNANLIYDKGTNGNASSLSAPPAHAPDLRPVNKLGGVASGITAAADSYVDLRARQAQTDNVKAQNVNITTDAILKAIQVDRNKVALEKEQGILPEQLDAAVLKNQQSIANIANKQADTTLKGSLATQADTNSGNLAVKRWILQNQADVLSATKDDTIKQAALKVLNSRMDLLKKQTDIEATHARTSQTYEQTGRIQDERERIAEAIQKIRADRSFQQGESRRRDSKDDRDWINSVVNYLTRYFIF